MTLTSLVSDNEIIEIRSTKAHLAPSSRFDGDLFQGESSCLVAHCAGSRPGDNRVDRAGAPRGPLQENEITKQTERKRTHAATATVY